MASLNLMQVPNGGTTQGLLMPKLQFRFRLNFTNFGTGNGDVQELTRQVIDCSRPNLSFAKITIPVYNSTIYMAGKHTWNTMTINLRDDATGSISQQVGAQLQKQLNFLEQASAVAASDYKFQLKLQMLDGGNGALTPVVLEEWDLEGCYLESANYNALNYATSEVVTISLTVQYDNATQVNNGQTRGGIVSGVNGPRTGSLATGQGSAGTTSPGIGA